MALVQHVSLTSPCLSGVKLGQEFIIKSQKLEDKVNQLLPSQGGFQAGVDLSASTTVIPIVDLTETAEGSEIRQDLQTAISHKTATTYSVQATSTTVVNTTGYYSIFGSFNAITNAAQPLGKIQLSDGVTTKDIITFGQSSGYSSNETLYQIYKLVVFLRAGDSLIINSTNTNAIMRGTVRQIADINGNLIDP